MLMSPVNMLMNSGSSSRLVSRSQVPKGVMRSASVPGPLRIVRNLRIEKSSPCWPGRVWRKKMGRPIFMRTMIDRAAINGERTMRAALAPTMSNSRFALSKAALSDAALLTAKAYSLDGIMADASQLYPRSVRVLYFHQHFSTRAGRTGTRSYEMAQRLLERGHRVTIVCGSFDSGATGLTGPVAWGLRRGVVDGIDVTEVVVPYSNKFGLLRRSWIFAQYALRASLLAVTEPADLVFASSTPLTAAIPGLVARVLRRRKFVFEVRDLWPELPEAMGVVTNPVVLKALDALESAAYRGAHACIGLSPGICDGITKKTGDTKPVGLVPNGSDLALFRPVSGIATSGGSRLRAIFTGAHGPANGLDAVLDAASHLKTMTDAVNVELHFMGDGKMKSHLVDRARSEGLSNCHFHDPMPKVEMAAELNSYDVGLMILDNVPAFYFGTSPNKFFDYISAGLPVLVNHPGWLANLVTEHDCGIAVRPDDPVAFAAALRQLADSPTDRARMGANARALAEREFSRLDLGDRFVDFLEAAAAS